MTVIFLCLHGQPTWSYIYRNFIKEFENRKLNFIVPDLIGFGLSDKPTRNHILPLISID